MRFTSTSILLLGAGAALVTTFKHSASDVNGLYLHGHDEAGNEVSHFVDPVNPTPPPFGNKTAPAKFSAKLMTRDSYGPHCNGIGANANDIYWATENLGQACDHSSRWYNTISYKFDSAIAYACDYGNGNNCDNQSLFAHKDAVDMSCGSNREGWFSIYDAWKYSDGRTNTDTGFCS